MTGESKGLENVEVTVLHQPGSIKVGCPKCHILLKSGVFAVGVTIGGHRHLLASESPIVCCGEEREVPLLSDSMLAASAAVQRAADALSRGAGPPSTRLLEATKFMWVAKP